VRSFRGQVARVRSLAYSPDGTILASGGEGGYIRLWDPSEGRPIRRFRQNKRRVIGLEFGGDGSVIASASGYLGVHLWSAGDGAYLGMIHDRTFAASSVAFRPGSRELLSCGWNQTRQGPRGFASIWDLGSRSSIARFTIQTTLTSSDIRPDGKLAAIGSSEGGIVIWDPTPLPEGTRLPDPEAATPPSQSSGGNYRVIPQKPGPRCVRFSPDGRLLAASAGWSIALHDLAGGSKVATLRGHRQPVKSLDFSPDGRTLASASDDGTVRLWAVEAVEERACYDWEIGRVGAAVFAPDGMTLAAGGDDGIVMWDVG
jgi:WD40 repeat protein